MNHVSNTSNNNSSPKQQQNLTFLRKLHIMLEEVEINTNQTDIVSWQPHGRCFRVHKTKEFVEKVMPCHFPQMTKWSSFYRQLNFHGFSRFAGNGPDKNGYYHKLFLRGKPQLCDFVIGTWKKGTKVRAKANVSLEPNFYSMPYIGTIDKTTATTNATNRSNDKTNEYHPIVGNGIISTESPCKDDHITHYQSKDVMIDNDNDDDENELNTVRSTFEITLIMNVARVGNHDNQKNGDNDHDDIPPKTELKPQLTYDLSDLNLTTLHRDSSWGEFIGDIMGDSSDDGLEHVMRRSFTSSRGLNSKNLLVERSRTV